MHTVARVILLLLGLVLVLVNLWRPIFGFQSLTGASAWASFAAGVIIILAVLAAGSKPRESYIHDDEE